eukprot:scaffold1869_cov122-Cylindrotheca_fusiformis.AAC.11
MAHYLEFVANGKRRGTCRTCRIYAVVSLRHVRDIPGIDTDLGTSLDLIFHMVGGFLLDIIVAQDSNNLEEWGAPTTITSTSTTTTVVCY